MAQGLWYPSQSEQTMAQRQILQILLMLLLAVSHCERNNINIILLILESVLYYCTIIRVQQKELAERPLLELEQN